MVLFKDFPRIIKSLNIYKALAAYNMVIIHGAFLFNVYKCTGLSYENWTMQKLSGLRGFFSLCLPALAGFYVRGQVGPYLDVGNGKLPKTFVSIALQFMAWAFILEGLRSYLITYKLSYFFFWMPLHFISLCMLVSYFLLYLDSRLMIVVPIVLLCLRDFAFRLGHYWEIESLSDMQSIAVALVWSCSFAALAVFGVSKFYQKPDSKYYLWALFCGSFLGTFFYIKSNSRSLLDFVNLPLDILLPRLHGDNSWAFVAFYPVFVAGYFLRAIFSGRKNSYLPGLVFIFSTLYSLYFFKYRLADFEGTISTVTLFSKQLFMMDSIVLMGVICFFFFTIFFLYFLLGIFRFRLLQKISFWSRNIIVLYLIHGFIFILFVHFFPFRALFSAIPDSTSFITHEHFVPLLVYYAILHLVYILSLYISHRATLWIDRSGVFSVVK